MHFASLDVRQDSSVHSKVLDSLSRSNSLFPENYSSLTEEEKLQALCKLQPGKPVSAFENDIDRDTIETMQAIQSIQSYNGEQGCNRYIISQCNSALNVMEVFALFKLSGWTTNEINIDIVPLFETIADLQRASSIMKQLYENEAYFSHI